MTDGGREKKGTGGKKLGTGGLEKRAALSWILGREPTRDDDSRYDRMCRYVGLDGHCGTGWHRVFRAPDLLALWIAYQVGSHSQLPAECARMTMKAGRLPSFVVWSEPDHYVACFDGDGSDAVRTLLHFDTGRCLRLREAVDAIASMPMPRA